MFIFLYYENILNSDHKVKVLYNDLPLKYDFYIELHNSMLQTAPPLATTANMIISYYATLVHLVDGRVATLGPTLRRSGGCYCKKGQKVDLRRCFFVSRKHTTVGERYLPTTSCELRAKSPENNYITGAKKACAR